MRIYNMPGPLSQDRLHSLDALRGMDMLLIIGLDSLLRSVSLAFLPESLSGEVWRQLGHCSWEGLTLYDLIFPIFVFISGASMYFSLTRAAEKGKDRLSITGKLWKRAMILVFLGLLVNARAMWDTLPWPLQPGSLRYASVLGLIGVSCALAGTAMIWLHRKWIAPVLAGVILAGVWGMQASGGDMTAQGCFNAKVDALLCPGVLHSGCFDPEGPLCIISATALALMGYCAGWLSRSGCRMCRQVLFFSLLGGLCVAVGSPCGLVIKGIWTPAFVLIAGGIGYLLLALFRPACDAWSKGEKFSMPLRVVGMNALFIYLVTHLPGYQELLQEVVRPILSFCASGATLDILCDFLQVGGAWLICYVLWRKRIFIKV